MPRPIPKSNDSLCVFLNRNRLRVEDSIRKAYARDMPHPVVFACDLTDPCAETIARFFCGDRQIDKLMESAVARRVPKVAFFSESLRIAAESLARVWPSEAVQALRAPPPKRHCRVVAFGPVDSFLVCVAEVADQCNSTSHPSSATPPSRSVPR
jgi:hypothetical protein